MKGLIRLWRAGVLLSLTASLCACAGVRLPGFLQQPVMRPVVTPVTAAEPATPAGVDLARAQAVASYVDASYQIGPEDALEISVWKDDTLKASTLVRPDGGISFPLVGEVLVAGKTAGQVRDELTRRLDKYVPEPVVNVSVVRVASYRIYVIGRVNKPGEFPLGRQVDVLQALSLAGGMTPFAEEDSIRVIRKVNGQSVSLPFDYARVRTVGDMSQNVMLKSGDVVLVP